MVRRNLLRRIGKQHGTYGKSRKLPRISRNLIAVEAEEQAKLEAESTRKKLLAKAKTEKGKSIINQLYRPVATIGEGGTADALIDEAINGPRPDGKQHYKKSKRPRCRNQKGAEERIGKR
jgi:hypothetical protein